jgi:hypothetical protein
MCSELALLILVQLGGISIGSLLYQVAVVLFTALGLPAEKYFTDTSFSVKLAVHIATLPEAVEPPLIAAVAVREAKDYCKSFVNSSTDAHYRSRF